MLFRSKALWPELTQGCAPSESLPESLQTEVGADDAVHDLIMGWMPILGPTSVNELAELFSLPESRIKVGMAALEAKGLVLGGHFRNDASGVEYCDRRLLARIHRITLEGLRSQIKPVNPYAYINFLLNHQGITQPVKGREALLHILSRLQGFEVGAFAWEHEVLSVRLHPYETSQFDQLTYQGKVLWGRPSPKEGQAKATSFSKNTPIALFLRAELPALLGQTREPESLSSIAKTVLNHLCEKGASFQIGRAHV